MNYDADDIVHLVGSIPYVRLMRPGSALALLRRQAAAIDMWGEFLPKHRTVLCERLDFAYVYLRCLGALDTLLLQDLLDHFTWRGIVWGACLASLDPKPEFRDLLIAARQRSDRVQWIVDLAIAAIDGAAPQDLAEHLGLIARIRAALAPIPKPATAFMRTDRTQYRELARDAETLRRIYHEQGSEAASTFLGGRSWRARLPGYRNRPATNGDHVEHAGGRAWSWGLHPPISTEDLTGWRPPAKGQNATPRQSRAILVISNEESDSRDKVVGFLERLDFQPIVLGIDVASKSALLDGGDARFSARFAIVLLTLEQTPHHNRRTASDAVIRALDSAMRHLAPQRVCVLKHGGMETPEGMSAGRYILFDDRGVWRSELAEELVAAAYQIDWNVLLDQ